MKTFFTDDIIPMKIGENLVKIFFIYLFTYFIFYRNRTSPMRKKGKILVKNFFFLGKFISPPNCFALLWLRQYPRPAILGSIIMHGFKPELQQ